MRVLIIGAGASGMLAALTAARSGHEAVLFERQSRVGRKLAATGNGRCNITNTGADVSRYHGENPEFARPALEALPVADTLALFRGIGLLTREEYGGRVYPLSNSANSVTDTLRFALEAEGVRLVSGDRVRALTRSAPRAARASRVRRLSSPAADSRAKSSAAAGTAMSF